jgi:hypothetical protein
VQVTESEWDAFCKDFDDTMAKFNVPEAEHKELFAIVESTKGDIVSAPSSLWRQGCSRSPTRWSSNGAQLPHRAETFAEGRNMMEDRFLKRLRKKARKGLRGWPIATVAFYGPNLSQATKVTVGIVPSENAEVEELRDWKVAPHRPGDIGIYRGAPSAISRDDRRHNRLSTPRRNW